MKIDMNWINEYSPVRCADVYEYMDKLTMIGQKTEGVEQTAALVCGVVVGKVLSVKGHEESEKLSITTVDVGGGRILSIVTGAKNVFAGAFVPVAPEGAVLADGTVIGRAEFRGVQSEGMLCSIEELGFTRHEFPEAPEHGIYIFTEDVEEGADVCDALMLKADIVEYEITGNRPDCFSVTGIAREAAAAYKTTFTMPSTTVREDAGGDCGTLISVEIKDKELCPRYAARVIKNVKVGASPLWMRRRLASAGLRPVNNIVDITNYVMLEMGQPMHAFDLNEVSGGIIVRRAFDGEELTTLDGNPRVLDSSMLVIADHEKAVAVAGVMGGQNSKITLSADGKAATGAVLLESACFNGTNIRLTSKKLGLRTDASSKYEKGLDPNLAGIALERAANLIEELCAGDVVKGVVDCFPDAESLAKKRTIPFEPDKINALLGIDITADDMVSLLKPFEIAACAEQGTAVLPTFRGDIEGSADLAEEVARAYGYDKIVPEMLTGGATVGKKTYDQKIEDIIKKTMVSFGFFEAITFSFEGLHVFDKLLVPEESPLRNVVRIMNPLGEGYGIMRTTAANSLLTALGTNYGKRNPEAFLFETANVYFPNELPVVTLPAEKNTLIAGMYGEKTDFYTAKGYVEALFDELGIMEYDFAPAKDIPWLHPGRCAVISIGGCNAGFIGEVHPDCLLNYDIGKRVYMFELETAVLHRFAARDAKYAEVPKYPAVQRDIALIIKEDILAKDLGNAIKELGGTLLQELTLFDVYRGGQVGEGYKSVAYSMQFRSADRTLSDNDVSPVMERIVEGVKERLGARIR